MTHLEHARVHREALTRSWTNHPGRYGYVTINSRNYVETDDEGYIELEQVIGGPLRKSLLRILIEDKDFGVMIDHMMQAHPEATIRAIGEVLAAFKQADD